jgi:hypothetical protein
MEIGDGNKLYHYTSQHGFRGIIHDGLLWMTNIRYLNDSSEYLHSLDLIKNYMEEYISKNERICLYDKLSDSESFIMDWNKKDIIDKRIHIYNRVISRRESDIDSLGSVYVFSLSKNKNDLNQWRGYCPSGIGYCIEFDMDELRSRVSNGEYQECIYTKNEKNELIENTFNNLESLYKQDSDQFKEETKKILKNDHLEDVDIIYFLHIISILFICSYIKHESFISENECRIVITDHKDIKIEYREGNFTMIPYTVVDLKKDNKLPITKIIIGPTPHPDLSVMSINNYMKSEGYNDVKVEYCNIPYRSWWGVSYK